MNNESGVVTIYTAYLDDESNNWYRFQEGASMKRIASVNVNGNADIYFEVEPPINTEIGAYQAILGLNDTSTGERMEIVIFTNVTDKGTYSISTSSIMTSASEWFDRILWAFPKPVFGVKELRIKHFVYLIAILVVILIIIWLGKKVFH